MKEKIRNILRESSRSQVLKNYIFKLLQKQVDSGLIPKLDKIDLDRKKINLDDVKDFYFDFIGGDQEIAFKLFKKYIENRIMTQDDIKNIGIYTHPEDKYRVKIYIYNPDYRGSRVVGSNTTLEVGFSILDGQFNTEVGVLTLEELYDEKYDKIWNNVTQFLMWDIGDYLTSVSSDFELEWENVEVEWND